MDTMTEVATRTPRDGCRDVGAQQALWFDDETDRSVDVVLTARGRRAVRPTDRPLTLIAGAAGSPPGAPPAADRMGPAGSAATGASGAAEVATRSGPARTDAAPVEPAPSDTDGTVQARARALVRAGRDVDEIARRLGADPALVAAWTREVAPGPVVRPRRRGPSGRTTRRPGAVGAVTGGTREGAADAARRRLPSDPTFAALVGALVGVAETEGDVLVIDTDRTELAALVVRGLIDGAGLEERDLRVVVRVGPSIAGDRARHAWAEALGVPIARVVATRWGTAPAPDAVRGLVRITDPAVVERALGWSDALLGASASRQRHTPA